MGPNAGVGVSLRFGRLFIRRYLVASLPRLSKCTRARSVNNLKHLVPWSHTFQSASPCLRETQMADLSEDYHRPAPQNCSARPGRIFESLIEFRFRHRQVIRNLHLRTTHSTKGRAATYDRKSSESTPRSHPNPIICRPALPSTWEATMTHTILIRSHFVVRWFVLSSRSVQSYDRKVDCQHFQF